MKTLTAPTPKLTQLTKCILSETAFESSLSVHLLGTLGYKPVGVLEILRSPYLIKLRWLKNCCRAYEISQFQKDCGIPTR
ncbi:hypothetical protein NDI45_29905 [Leptolyngbya sp. GB1-A1]|uniref:hypothetical protein n=1 Tax=Leptolyngbya sp. GB1-A1 TaxID=2933908 RepID=UPI003299E518